MLSARFHHRTSLTVRACNKTLHTCASSPSTAAAAATGPGINTTIAVSSRVFNTRIFTTGSPFITSTLAKRTILSSTNGKNISSGSSTYGKHIYYWLNHVGKTSRHGYGNGNRGSFRTFVFARRGEQSSAKGVPVLSSSTRWWRTIATVFKVARIPFLIATVFGLGYNQGVTETIRNPLKVQQAAFESVCTGMGVQSGEDVELVSERPPTVEKFSRLAWLYTNQKSDLSEHSPRAKKLAYVGREIIRAARKHVREEFDKAVETAKLKIQRKDLNEIQIAQVVNEDEKVQFWMEALERIEGYSLDGIKNWQYILIGTPVPNAFVAEVLPQRFFVTTGLFEILENDDELAFVLGHEISHLIYGHVTSGQEMEFLLRGLEILFLMLDPTDGFLSLGVAGFLASSRQTIMAAHSRQNEFEADELGCKLAAMACFDTKRGANIMLKFHELIDKRIEETTGVKNDILSTHPPSMERYEALMKQSVEENSSKYPSTCKNLRNRINRALTLAKKQKG